MSFLRRCVVGSALVLCFLVPVASAVEMSQSEVEEALTCQCGCGLTVHTCNHLECSFAVPVRKDIAESLARGESGEEILERYKREYGEKVLSSPIPEGFNLLAWLAPYAAIAISAVVVVGFLRRRARTGSVDEPASERAGTEIAADDLDERRRRLREEMRDEDL